MGRTVFSFYKFRWLEAVNRRRCSSNSFSRGEVKNKEKPFNSLDKIDRFRKYKDLNDCKITERICLTVVGNGAIGQPRCVGLFTEHKCYLFNCGEGVMRLIREHELPFLKLKHFFVTEKVWGNLSGLVDVYLTMQYCNFGKMTVHGPPGVENFVDMASCREKRIRIVKKNIEDSPFIDETLEVQYVSVLKQPRHSWSRNYKNSNKRLDNISGKMQDSVMSYICKVKAQPSQFSPEKCVEHGVPIGPLLLDLKNGENVMLPSGKMVLSRDVHAAGKPGSVFLVVDCPYENMIDSFVAEPKLDPGHMSDIQSHDIVAVFHFSSLHVMQSYKYLQWINKFPSTTLHFVLNSHNGTKSNQTVHCFQHVFHHLHPHVFPLLHEKPSCALPELLQMKENVIQADAQLQLHLRPNRSLDRSNVVNFTPDDDLRNAYEIPGFKDHVQQLHKVIGDQESSVLHGAQHKFEEYPEIVFLGTASSSAIGLRNVSAILANVSPENSILLDCGEGTYTQFMRYFGYHNIASALMKISCIFISHHHADHFLGLFELVKARREAFLSSSETYAPVSVITTRPTAEFIVKFQKYFGSFRRYIREFPCHLLREKKSAFSQLKNLLGGVEICTVLVKHCPDAHAVVLSGKDWKIVYSGDAAPSQSLVDAGRDCTVLIHEASVVDELCNEAARKFHSTPSQAMEVAEKMNAQHTILTHFSKRYMGMPPFPENANFGCAFDNMRVRMQDLPLLPKFLPVLKCLFSASEERKANLEKSVASVNFEKAFLISMKMSQ